ncbi:SpoIIE family protein phosphatase [Nocardioides pakistanensis]
MTVPQARKGNGLPLDPDRVRLLLAHLPAAVAYLDGPDHVFTMTNGAYEELVGGRRVVGLPVREALPELAGQGFFELLDEVLDTGEPLVRREARVELHRTGGSDTVFVDFVYQPVSGADGRPSGVLVHAVDVSDHVRTRRAVEELAHDLAAAEDRHRRLFDTLPAAVVYQDASGEIIAANPAAVTILGIGSESLLGRDSDAPEWEAVREDGTTFPGQEHPAMVALRTGAVVRDVVMGIRHGRTGQRRWLNVTAVPDAFDHSGAAQRVYTISSDITEPRRTAAALAESEQLVTRLRESNALAIAVADEEAVREANDRFLDMIGYNRADLDCGRISWREITPPEWEAADEEALHQLRTRGVCAAFEKQYVHRDGHRVPVLLGAATIGTDPLRWVTYAVDLTAQRTAEAARAAAAERELAAQAAATAAEDQVAVLLRAGSLLAATRDIAELLRRAADIVVSAFGDWAIVLVPEDEQRLRVAAAAHADAARSGLTLGLVGRTMPITSRLGPASAFRTGSTRIVDDVMGEFEGYDDQTLVRAAALLEPATLVAAPLVTASTTLGVLAVGRSAGRPPFGDLDAALVTELARQLALGLRNAQVSAHEHSVAETLQRAVLPPRLPATDGLRLEATYLPATTGVSVGGDFYDAFELDSGRVGLVVGDVAGHDIDAASEMGQLRNGLRMIAALNADPAAVLADTQRALARLLPDVLATVFYGVLDTSTGELVYANAGHPAPLVVDGPTGTFLEDPPGPMLGAVPEARFPLRRHRIPEGGTLILYTDGLIEDRRRPIDEGMRELMTAATVADPGGTEPLSQRVTTALLGSLARADDICVLTARLSFGGP